MIFLLHFKDYVEITLINCKLNKVRQEIYKISKRLWVLNLNLDRSISPLILIHPSPVADTVKRRQIGTSITGDTLKSITDSLKHNKNRRNIVKSNKSLRQA